MKTQVVVIHGGDHFETYEEYLDFLRNFEIDLGYFKKKGWKDNLQNDLGDNFDVILPKMPNSFNARYIEWKIWFEKLIPLLDEKVILVGHSLGGIFLAKYLSENTFPKTISGTFLVAAPFDDKDADYKLLDFNLSADLSNFEKQGGEISLYHSNDDDCVPFVDLSKYQKSLKNAHAVIFEDKGHFREENFPELVEDIKSLK